MLQRLRRGSQKAIIKQLTLIIYCVFISQFLITCKKEPKPIFDINPIEKKAQKALQYCKQKGMNTNFCILVDMKSHSGLYRLFVWDFKKKQIIKKSLVSHGCCDKLWSFDSSREKVKFSNVPNSHCSSKGKYRIGKRGYSNWGIHINYKLHGLEKTNNNAFKRVIVLHSWKAIPDKELYPRGTPEGWGCPAVSNKMMKYLDSKLKKEKKVLMWLFN